MIRKVADGVFTATDLDELARIPEVGIIERVLCGLPLICDDCARVYIHIGGRLWEVHPVGQCTVAIISRPVPRERLN